MNKNQKQMIREMSKIVTEDIIKMIEDVESIQKKAEKADRKARAKKRAKKARKWDREWERKQDDAVDAIRYSSLPLDEVGDDFLVQAMDDLSPADDYIDISEIRLTPPPF